MGIGFRLVLWKKGRLAANTVLLLLHHPPDFLFSEFIDHFFHFIYLLL